MSDEKFVTPIPDEPGWAGTAPALVPMGSPSPADYKVAEVIRNEMIELSKYQRRMARLARAGRSKSK